MSHRKGMGVSVGQGSQKKKRRQINIPSVVDGKEVSPKEAIDSFFGKGKEGTLNRALGRKKDPNRKGVTKSFKDIESATKASKARSKAFNPKEKLTLKKKK